MWAVKILKGPQTGQVIELKVGDNIIGRGPACAVRLNSQGISKEHAKLTVTDAGLSVADLNSTNGTFVNGSKVRLRPVKKGDRISLHDIIFEIVDQNPSYQNLPVAGNNALSPASYQTPQPQQTPQESQEPSRYFETVALPGVYKLAENFEFKWVIGCFVLGYVLLVTLFSVIPMAQITKSSIEVESQRRAMTIAQGLSDRFQMALIAGQTGNFDTRFAEREEGVKAAFILSASDGSIIAPVSRSGAYAQEPFVHNARKHDEKMIEQLDSQTIGASIPIEVYDPDTGLKSPKYYAMVLYNMGSLAVDDGRVTSLFIKVLGIALLFGFLLFVFLYRLIEIPVQSLNASLDAAIREGRDKVESPYNYPTIQKLALTITSLLSRASSHTPDVGTMTKDFVSEAIQLARLMTNPALSIDPSGTVLSMNAAMASELNVSMSQCDGINYSRLPDDALSALIPELVERSRNEGAVFFSTPIHFKSRDLELNLQPIKGSKGVDYYIITLTDPNGGLSE